MADYGRPLQLGFFPSPQADDYTEVLTQVRLAEEYGLDLIGVQDHPYQRRFLDTFALIASLAAQTERLRFFPDVANLPLRGAPIIAKQAAAIDRMSGGRFELGLGAGGFWDAIEAMGGPRRAPGEAVSALRDAIAVIRALWSEERGLRIEGDFYRLAGVHGGPPPAHDIGIWVGATGPRMLRLIGDIADGWVPSAPYLPPEQLPEAHARIDEAVTAAGRDPAAIVRAYNVSGQVTERASEGFLHGPADQWVDELAGLVIDGGMDTFVLWPQDAPDTQLRRFGEQVVPALRSAVDAARAR